jgi:hypothetical protein
MLSNVIVSKILGKGECQLNRGFAIFHTALTVDASCSSSVFSLEHF